MMRRNVSRAAGALGLLSAARKRANTTDIGALVGRAEQILNLRRRRIERFGKGMFGEPAWDILLSIYVSEQRGECPTIAELTSASCIAPSVALRWLNFLVGEGFVERDVHPANLDHIMFQLTASSRANLECYLRESIT